MINPHKITSRLRLLRWAVPFFLAALVVLYQLGLANWLLHEFGEQYHTLAELLLYGVGGPLLAMLSLDFLIRWLEERETSELQSRILDETRDIMASSREINDETLQTLYAISIMLASLKSSLPESHSERAALMQETELALNQTMTRLRSHLQDPAFRQPASQNGRVAPSTPVSF